MKQLLYLACPYSHPDPAEREKRYHTANRVASKLMQSGIVVFSPLSHSVPIARHIVDVELDHQFWMNQDLPILRRCDEILVLGLDGWEQSEGVRKEMFEALALRKPVTLIDEVDIENLPAIPSTARRFLKSSILPDLETL